MMRVIENVVIGLTGLLAGIGAMGGAFTEHAWTLALGAACSGFALGRRFAGFAMRCVGFGTGRVLRFL